MIMIGLFFLCCPGKHIVAFDNKAFKLLNIQFYLGDKLVPTQSSLLLSMSDFLTLTFVTQKNGVKGKCSGHRQPNSASLSPILAVAHQVAHLNHHKAKPH